MSREQEFSTKIGLILGVVFLNPSAHQKIDWSNDLGFWWLVDRSKPMDVRRGKSSWEQYLEEVLWSLEIWVFTQTLYHSWIIGLFGLADEAWNWLSVNSLTKNRNSKTFERHQGFPPPFISIVRNTMRTTPWPNLDCQIENTCDQHLAYV